MARKYSLAEIDRMRAALDHVVMINVSYMGNERRQAIESQLRTYVMAGADPEDLYNHCMEHVAQRQASDREFRRIMNDCART